MGYHWSIHQLTEYLVALSQPDVAAEAVTVALERATEALEAELGVVAVGGTVVGSAGFGGCPVPASVLEGTDGQCTDVPLIGDVHLVSGRLDTRDGRAGTPGGRLIVGRLEEGYSAEERQMLQGMALVLGLRLESLARLVAEQQRHRLVDNLLQIQRAISLRQPLEEVLDAVTAGASALLGEASVALMLIDPLEPSQLRPVSRHNLPEIDSTIFQVARRTITDLPVGEFAPIDRTMLAERVVVAGEVLGCMVARIRSAAVGDRSPAELLSAFTQQVNLALTDARTLDAVREAHRDPVTALPNRTLFLQRLEAEREAALREARPLTVLFIDLDRFKAVNDTLGHRAGDCLLADVAHRILTCVDEEDTAARLGGDEFAVLLRGADRAIGCRVAERIISALAHTFTIEGRDVLIGASVGVADLTGPQHSSATLLGDADVAMYSAKRAGRGRWAVFLPQMHDEVDKQLGIRTDLRKALTGSQFWLAYQPIVDIATGRVDGVEALLRWDHPTRGAVPPLEFIPIAEEIDLIGGLGNFVIDTALADLATWRRTSPDLKIAVNVSWRQLIDPHLLTVLGDALQREGLPAPAVTLEVTESLLMSDPARAGEALSRYRALGVHLAIDDFGTGYSSLAYLRQFAFDQVKIDRTFVSGLRAGGGSQIALIRGIFDLCRALDLQTVAEGIEEVDELAVLADLGCALGQGYYFARPRPATDRPHELPVDGPGACWPMVTAAPSP